MGGLLSWCTRGRPRTQWHHTRKGRSAGRLFTRCQLLTAVESAGSWFWLGLSQPGSEGGGGEGREKRDGPPPNLLHRIRHETSRQVGGGGVTRVRHRHHFSSLKAETRPRPGVKSGFNAGHGTLKRDRLSSKQPAFDTDYLTRGSTVAALS